MMHTATHIKHLTIVILYCLVVTSCHVENYREVCDYNIQLRYDYNEENTSQGVNMIEYYVHQIDEYIFDEAGILFQHRTFTPDRCTEYLNSELTLPPGRYSVIAIGNKDERSTVFDAANSPFSILHSQFSLPVAGVTHRDDMRMILNNSEIMTGGTSGPSEKLYHGYKTFTVKESGISRVRVDMINAHLVLRFRVTWRNNATPATGEGYHATLQTIPSQYALMPQYIYPAGSFECQVHECDKHDQYPSNCNNVIHHIPLTCYKDKDGNPVQPLAHRNNTRINGDKEMWGEFTTYRIKMADSPQLRIYRSATTAGDSDEMIIPKAIDLGQYLEWYSHQPDYELKQEYLINIIIDGDQIILMPLDISDWDEGGML